MSVTSAYGPLHVDGGERHRILVEWNATTEPFPANKTVAELFDERVAIASSSPALIWSSRSLSYGDLNGLANGISEQLLARGVAPGDLIGLALRRSPDFVASVLAVLKSGAAFLPLDPDYPASRLQFMIADAKPALVITGQSVGADLPAGVDSIMVEDAIEDASRPVPAACTSAGSFSSDDIAYVVYTSGSTGQPKGVMNTHKGLINRLSWLWRAWPYAPDEVACNKTSPNFVDGTTELLGPLLQGVPVVLASADDAIDPERLSSLIRQHGVTRLTAVPGLLDVLLDYSTDLQSLRLCISSGETLSQRVAERFLERLPSAQLLNLYGMSEANGDSLATVVEAGGLVPIGRPIANTSAYILDEDLRPVKVDAAGELYIGGVGLARGYLNRPDMTAERFIRNPYAPGRLYRTGDLARWRSDGLIEYLGRTDSQVKFNGFRVELGEIEAALLREPRVTEAVVVPHRDGDVISQLAAYVVCQPEAGSTAGNLQTALRSSLSRILPAHMHPQTISIVNRLPRTPNGKVDRQALVQVRDSRSDNGDIGDSEIGRKLSEIWHDLLGVTPKSNASNFFELGGHSMLALRMLARVEKSFGKRVRLVELLRDPRFGALASLLWDTEDFQQDCHIISIQPHGRRPPILAINNTGLFFPLARRLGSDQPFIALQSYDPEVPEKVEPRSFEAIASDYVPLIRRYRPRGPYVLLGLCARGVLAYEIAQQLQRQDEDIALLIIIDAWAPGYTSRLPRWQRVWAEGSYRRQLFHAQVRMAQGGGRGKLRYLGHRVGQKLHLVSRPIETEDWYHPHLVRSRMQYRPQPYGGRTLILRRRTQPAGRFLADDLGWSALLTGDYQIRFLPDPPARASPQVDGTLLHLALFQNPGVSAMAGEIEQALRRPAWQDQPARGQQQ